MTYRCAVRLSLRSSRPSLVPLLATGALVVGLVGLAPVGPSAADVGAPTTSAAAAVAPTSGRAISYHQWDGGPSLRKGVNRGTAVTDGQVVLHRPSAHRTFDSRTYDTGSWTSPWVDTETFTQLIASWSATTPGDSFVEIRVRGRATPSVRPTTWDVLARWASSDAHVERQSISGQSDDGTDVNVDTWRAPAGLRSFQLNVKLLRRSGTAAAPAVDVVGAMVSRLPEGTRPTSRPGVARGVVLDVPRYSQMIHRGHYPQWGSGGEAWCSPTSTSMVLGYYGALPRKRAYPWVPAGHTDPWVDYAARMTYDHAYRGAGNWPFNTAYAAPRAGRAFVTRLRSLAEAEKFIKAGIPLVASIKFGTGELDGAPISATNGHLLVIAGFTRSGDVVVNDPASTTRAGVRRTYDRGQLERAWLGGSGGVVYVIHDAAHRLPRTSKHNW